MGHTYDFITNGRRKQVTIQTGLTHSNSDTSLSFKNKDGNETATIQGDGKANLNSLNLSNLPTSASGLTTGDVWNDSGVLKIK